MRQDRLFILLRTSFFQGIRIRDSINFFRRFAPIAAWLLKVTLAIFNDFCKSLLEKVILIPYCFSHCSGELRRKPFLTCTFNPSEINRLHIIFVQINPFKPPKESTHNSAAIFLKLPVFSLNYEPTFFKG